MKKRIFVFILTLTLCLLLGVPALAVGNFYDVGKNAWYLKYLDTAVNSGLIDGRGDGRFAPNDDITGAEAVKLAGCIGQLLSEGSVTLTNGSPWYANYMEYAVEHGFIDARFNQYTLNAPIMRAELMDMLGLIAGAVTPLGLLNDDQRKVRWFLDRDFAGGRIGVHPNDNTATVWLQTEDLLELIREHGNPAQLSLIPEKS